MKRLFQRIQSSIVLSIINRLLAYVDQEIEDGTPKEQARLRKIRRTFIELKLWIADPTSVPSDPNGDARGACSSRIPSRWFRVSRKFQGNHSDGFALTLSA